MGIRAVARVYQRELSHDRLCPHESYYRHASQSIEQSAFQKKKKVLAIRIT